MNTIYEASPECRERQCKITRTDDIVRLHFVYQHGDNPEAVLIVDRYSQWHDPATFVRAQFREFAERCHRYDDGEVGPFSRPAY